MLIAGGLGRRVSRVLLGEPGMTYRYKGLRLFARPWRAPPGEPEVRAPPARTAVVQLSATRTAVVQLSATRTAVVQLSATRA